MSAQRCPACEKLFLSAQSSAKPFCSERCRQIDLGLWLEERHSVAVRPDEKSEEEITLDF
ncbi:MAG: DNA gyrase inhibitor YacG [Planctomycetaceae bacterium]|nr:DNA gyrase inhibitor YacG [Planctomycetaceae bacterium]MBP63596.1 DNA gyrase inhibitor YacG [Planctomycetaceae bacterium]